MQTGIRRKKYVLSLRGKVGCVKHIHPVYSDSGHKVQTRHENGLYKDIVRTVQTKQKAVHQAPYNRLTALNIYIGT